MRIYSLNLLTLLSTLYSLGAASSGRNISHWRHPIAKVKDSSPSYIATPITSISVTKISTAIYSFAPALEHQLPIAQCTAIITYNGDYVCSNSKIPTGTILSAGATIELETQITSPVDALECLLEFGPKPSTSAWNVYKPNPAGSSQKPACALWANNPAQYTPCASTIYGIQYNSTLRTTVTSQFDCLLDLDVQVYQHSEIGHEVAYWSTSTYDYYRFYDNNNMAWFIRCYAPGVPYVRRQRARRSLRKTKRGGRTKDDGCPIWDFRGPTARDAKADPSDMWQYAYPGNNPVHVNPDGEEVPGVAWAGQWTILDGFPLGGQMCDNQILSRPGLQQWTVNWDTEW